jgi:hypothetical protein
MTISRETHDALTEIELLGLIQSCSDCQCGHDCYCASNLEWAEKKLEALRARRGSDDRT